MSQKEQLKVTLIQTHLHWENAKANRAMLYDKIMGITEETDIVVLPEMFTTGFSMNADVLAEEREGFTVMWMKELAARRGCALVGSIIVKDNECYYNRLYFITEEGAIFTYNKKHTFTLAGEHKTYTAGRNRVVIDYKGWRIFPLVCYDLRFPVWARNTENYDVLLYVANWPKKRITAWDALLKARAIENMSYCVGVNRVGLDGNGHEYTGHSAIYDVLGTQISTQDYEKEFVDTVTLSKTHITKNRKHLQFLNDADAFTLT